MHLLHLLAEPKATARVDFVAMELGLALHAVNAEFAGLTARQRQRVEIIPDDSLNAALTSGNHDRGVAAVTIWRDEQLAAIRGSH